MDQNDAQRLFKGLSPEQQKNVQSILADKDKTNQILSTPQAQALLRRLTGEDKNG